MTLSGFFHSKKVQITAAVLLGIFLTCITARRCRQQREKCSAHQVRRHERQRRRAHRRAEWKRWLHSVVTSRIEEHEEKNATAAEPANFDSVSLEIAEFSRAASIVSDIVAAEEGRSIAMNNMDLPGYRSTEELPRYEEADGSEASTIVADGFHAPPQSASYAGSEDSGVRSIINDQKDYE